MTASYIEPIQRELDDNGLPVVGAKLRFYVNNTTTPLVVYQDSALSVPFAQPVLSDAAGFYARVFVPQGLYKRTRHTSADVLIASDNDLDTGLSATGGALAISAGGTGATTAAGARTALGVPSTSVTDSLDTRISDIEGDLAVPDVAAFQTATYSASLTLVFTTNENWQVTLTGDVTINAPTVTAGTNGYIRITQDATGGRVATWNSAWRFAGGSPPALSRAPNASDFFHWVARSTGIIEVVAVKIQDPRPSALPDLIFEDQQTSGTPGGTATSGSDEVRRLTTEVIDRLGIGSISSNQFTIAVPGTYYIEWEAPAWDVGGPHQSMLWSVTTATVLARGRQQYAGASVHNTSEGQYLHVITAAHTYEIRHRVTTTKATNGYGYPGGFGTEIYTRVKVWKVA